MKLITALIPLLLLASPGNAEEPHDHNALGDAGQFYSKWMRPKGNFSGIFHRGNSCCSRTDCSPVTGVTVRDGQMFAQLEREPGRWYKVDPAIIESNQEDPRESPDIRSHGCVIGGIMACFVEGGGI